MFNYDKACACQGPLSQLREERVTLGQGFLAVRVAGFVEGLSKK